MSDKDKDWVKDRKARLNPSGGNTTAFEVPEFDYTAEDQGKFNWGTNGKYSSKLMSDAGIYMAKITVGSDVANKNQSLDLLVDTSSSWTWVYSCDKHVHQFWKEHYCNYFDKTLSTTL